MKQYIDVDEIERLAEKGLACTFTTDLAHPIFNRIIELITQPLGDIVARGSVKATLSRNVIRYLQPDVLGHEANLVVQQGGSHKNYWYRIDMPRLYAEKLLCELEDEWLHGPTEEHRGMFRRAYKKLNEALNV